GKNLFNNIFMTHLLFDSQCQQIDQTVSFITQQSGTDNLLFIIQNNLYFSNWFISVTVRKPTSYILFDYFIASLSANLSKFWTAIHNGWNQRQLKLFISLSQ